MNLSPNPSSSVGTVILQQRKGTDFQCFTKSQTAIQKNGISLLKNHRPHKLENKTFSQKKRDLVWCGSGSWAVGSNSKKPALWSQREIPNSDREKLSVVG